MIASWPKEVFLITGPLWGESTSYLCILKPKGQLYVALIFALMLAWTNCLINIQVADDFRHHSAYAMSLWYTQFPSGIILNLYIYYIISQIYAEFCYALFCSGYKLEDYE